VPRPNAPIPQPHWKSAGHHAERRRGGEQVHHRGRRRDQQAAEGEDEQQEAEPDDGDRNHGSLASTAEVKSAIVALWPPTYTRSVVPCSAAGIVLVRKV